jgi:Xaa-Pro aminopeptidase
MTSDATRTLPASAAAPGAPLGGQELTQPFEHAVVRAAAAAAAPALLEAVRARLATADADALLVTAPANVRYLSGFSTPVDGRVLVTGDAAWLLTDDRYTVQASDESWLGEQVIADDWPARVADLVAGQILAIEAEHLTVAQRSALERRLGVEVIPTEGLMRPLRMRKRGFELTWLREAARVTDEALDQVVEAVLRPGVREFEVAFELERAMRRAGADGASFEVIVASGPRGAMPHGVASTRRIERGDLVTIDVGARLAGYHADLTRTYGVGPVAETLRSAYQAVAAAQAAALAAIAPGVTGVAVDAIARERLARHGLAEHFTHSLGHGTGLEIHEGPSLSRRSQDTLEPGMVVTVEPGVYLAGKGGVRIEDLVLITDTGHEPLSAAPKDYRELG